jgi:uncharacterized cupredoxin-like copper-binding protein
LLVVALTACSAAATPTPTPAATPTRTPTVTPTPVAGAPVVVNVTATEFKFDSTLTTFQVGVPYRFVVKDTGAVAHDWWVLPRGEMDEEKALFGIDGDDLLSGATETRDYVFTQPGDYEFACHITGHYEAGMRLPITVK